MTRIRVVVVEDSVTVRKRLIEVLAKDSDVEVVGEGEDGKDAIDLCQKLRPDVVTLDMMLPVMSGLAATEYIMAHCPTPILIVSASTNRGELFRTYDALAAGAVDVLEKQRHDDSAGDWERKLLSTVKLVSRIKVITHLRAKMGWRNRATAEAPPTWFPEPSSQRAPYAAVAIGVSTGGPAAIQQILRSLSPRFPLPILLVIHIGEPFGLALAEWLGAQSPLRVDYAVDGEPLPPKGEGRVFMAPPDLHMVVRSGRIRLTTTSERHSCRPSVDVLFESAAEEFGERVAACLLTGMGKDGAAGLLAVRRAGGATFAQDEATSVVFGMPREAILLDAAERVLPLQEFGPALTELAHPRSERGHA
jgi:two-component system, chemotaxis family, protein-glutamate methylesterase/glutaminase